MLSTTETKLLCSIYNGGFGQLCHDNHTWYNVFLPLQNTSVSLSAAETKLNGLPEHSDT